ncbi:MAG TPA: M3 family metallopeptidase [Vicinamibacterales bacterium]|jgi:thimet oligopeptidase
MNLRFLRIPVGIAAIVLVAAVPVSVQETAPATEAADAPFTNGLSNAASLQSIVDGRIARARQSLDQILAVRGPRTAANTLRPYDDMLAELNTAAEEASVLAAVHPDDGVRRAGDELERKAVGLSAEIQLRGDVFTALTAIRTDGLDADTKYFLAREIAQLRRTGVDRPADTRAKLQKLRDELTAIMAEFQRNIREGQRRWSVSAADLGGLPADFVARHAPDSNGAITLTTDNVDARPVLTYATKEDVRKRMYIESYTVAYPKNIVVLDRMLAIRGEIARLLGYPNWASYDMASRMAGDVKTVSSFIDRVVAAASPKATREAAELLALKQRDVPGASLQVWDRAYYAELVRRASYDFDSQSLRPYLSFDRVLAGVFDVTGRIFGLTFQQVSNVPVWHPSVLVYEILDGARMVGRVYLDLHPRANKSSTSASVTTVRQGVEGRHLPEAVLVASLPGGQPGDPGLMTHDEVRTLFHEFGHVVHRMVGGHRRWAGLSSVTMERDFVEAPSQMLEEWLMDPATLASFAKHYQTGQAVPSRLVMQMRRANEFGQGLEVKGQMVFAKASLAYHDRDPAKVDTTALWKEIHNQYLPYPHVDGTYRQAVFVHLGNPGYASSYYTYMWALVIAKDLFSAFDGKNLLEPGLARRYMNTVLAAGSSKPAAELVRQFLGRPFNFTAWQNWLNRDTPAVSTQ